MLYIYILAFAIFAYLIGSIPTGYLIVKAKTGQDIRTIGSGSTGATNVKRVLGKKWFFIVMLLDAFKGAFPIIVAKTLNHYNIIQDNLGIFALICALFVIIGHSRPVFLQFKGGKSVASGVGTILALDIVTGLSVAVIWAIITYISKYVSLGSIIAVTIAPIMMYILHKPIGYTLYCLIAAIYIIYLHRQNISRLIKGEENKVR